ncbi:MAG: ATP-binding protein, partial [Leptolyngbya sp. SIO4C1]|nr:ATP-binding protein [Leptolyngbya sp. SIO4C1]
MTAASLENWLAANQQYLTHALAEVRALLEQRTAASSAAEPAQTTSAPAITSVPPAIETLCQLFGLTPFERQIVLLCAGVELDARFASLCATLHGDPRQPYATFSLALEVLPEAHWTALYPDSSLRRWRLVEVGSSEGLTRSPLRIDERVLHYLTGGDHLDERLAALMTSVAAAEPLVPSHQALAERLVAIWAQTAVGQTLPVVQLCGADSSSQRAIAARACAILGLNIHALSTQVLPTDPRELEALMRLWEREAALSQSALLLDCQGTADAARSQAISHLVETLNSGLILISQERRRPDIRPLITQDVRPPTLHEQQSLWQSALAPVGIELNGAVTPLVSQFNLNAPKIRSVCIEALGHLGREKEVEEREKGKGEREKESPLHPSPFTLHPSPFELQTLLWDICRVQTRPHLEDLAQRIEPKATLDDLVLPELQKQLLREIAVHVRQKLTVYEDWGFASKSARGLGISALFAGLSGTGKTMAAEVLAQTLRLDLYRIDLSSVVSKYIGETEKNLRRVFDAAEQGGAILLFDEADALFGKRSDVKDSHDRYANIEVSYLLQRMEAYQGLAILTTNLKTALDTAFLRRLRFIVQFPFPDMAQRAEIWRRIFPETTPTKGLDVEKLARLNVSGGNIRNIAVYAAFLAAEE